MATNHHRRTIISTENFYPVTGYVLITVIGEALLQFLAGEEDAALDSTEGKIHLLGDLIVLVAGHVHGERNAVFIGEFVDGHCNFACTVGFLGRFETAVLAQVEVVEIVGGIHDCRCASCAAVVVDEDITHYRHHPCLEVCVLGIFILIVESLQGGILEKIVCIVAVGCEHVCEVEKIRLKVHQVSLERSRGCHNYDDFEVSFFGCFECLFLFDIPKLWRNSRNAIFLM